jgi:hypothetical protein
MFGVRWVFLKITSAERQLFMAITMTASWMRTVLRGPASVPIRLTGSIDTISRGVLTCLRFPDKRVFQDR